MLTLETDNKIFKKPNQGVGHFNSSTEPIIPSFSLTLWNFGLFHYQNKNETIVLYITYYYIENVIDEMGANSDN